MTANDTERRLDRLEARESIRELAQRYALYVDSRDLDRLLDLFVPDVGAGRGRRGRDALRPWFDAALRGFTTSIHFVANHVIDLDDESPDRASGVVYCRAEHEAGDAWMIIAMQYWDRYRRVDSRWLFESRSLKAWYSADMLDRPTGPDKIRWDVVMPTVAELPTAYPSWDRFWASAG